jgi:mRNA (guanine-N7-)-methyltransferase
MEIESNNYNKLLEFITECKKNKTYEFEARFTAQKKNIITEDNYIKVFEKFTFSRENNGLAFRYSLKNMLDIMIIRNMSDEDFDNTRMTINDSNDIKKYWVDQNNTDVKKDFMEKEKLDKIDDKNFNIRYSLNNEVDKKEIMEKNINLLVSNEMEKIFRLKNRYSIITDDNLFQIDLTSVKTGRGKNFKVSNTLKSAPNYEIEIEFIGHDTSITNEEIIKKLLTYINIILAILQNNNILLKSPIVEKVVNYYKELVNIKDNSFIAASPVTIHRINVVKSDTNNNILNKYAVSLKADGERNFLIVLKSYGAENGKIFLFNNNFDVIDTGFVDESFAGSLIEGELVTHEYGKEFFGYDILFHNGEDIRRRHLVSNDKTGFKQMSRLESLDIFIKSNKRQIANMFNEKNTIKITKKLCLFSILPDGSDIFKKIEEVWESKKISNFHVDGMIFTPITEYYPLKSGSWYSLFKWKPPNLNSIDFLIKTKKNDIKQDIKSPFIVVVNRPDGKKETYIQQYKIVKLYVSEKKFGINNYNRKNYPVEFNPYDLDNANANSYNEAKIMIDEKEKMYANDPLTGEIVEIFDDSIVEFTYDDSVEDYGFKWKPIRYRRDKTNLYKGGADVYGNNHNVAKDNFKSIKFPVSEEMILTGKVPLDTGGVVNSKINPNDDKQYWATFTGNDGKQMERYAYQNFHNLFIKTQLYNVTSPAHFIGNTHVMVGKLLDLCSGKGVDITKIKKAHYAEVVGMDIDGKATKFAQEFYQKRIPKPKPKAFYVRGDSSKLIWPEQATAFSESDKIYTRKYIPTKYYFDTISIQFCIHYFFKNEISLRTMMQNLNDNLKIGGYVIGTCFDGERINNSFNRTKSIEGKLPSKELLWKIDKSYTSKLLFSGKPIYGKEIDVFVKTIGISHKEYIVSFNFLDSIMEAYGFSKVMIKPFEEYYNELMNGHNDGTFDAKEFEKIVENAKNITEIEKKFSFLSSSFIYKKEKNSPDSLLKKLIQLMEKESKEKRTNGIVVEDVNADLENAIEDLEESGII